MTWIHDTARALSDAGIEMVAYLPDSLLAPLVDQLASMSEIELVPVAREEEAVGVLTGAWLGGTQGALLCQSSGLVNTFNLLGTHAVPAGLPFLGVINRRGNLGEHNHAQVPPGYNLPALLDAIGVRHHLVGGPDTIADRVLLAAETAFSTEQPYMLVVEPAMMEG